MVYRSTLYFFSIVISLAISSATFSWADQLKIFVSVIPQKHFVQKIGQSLVNVQVMVPPGASPATYEPKPRQMVALANAKAYFSIGVPFEQAWLSRITASNQHMQVVATDQGIQKMAMAEHEDEHGHHDADESHDHSGLDPHIWTSPPLVKIQARNILAALQQLDPANSQQYAANYKVFMQELDALDQELRAIFDPLQGQHFMVFHPSWGYFAHTYGLVQVPVEMEGKAPKPAQLKTLITQAREKQIKVIFVQPQFSAKSAQLIATAIGGRVITADPLALDWENNLRQQAMQFKEVLR